MKLQRKETEKAKDTSKPVDTNETKVEGNKQKNKQKRNRRRTPRDGITKKEIKQAKQNDDLLPKEEKKTEIINETEVSEVEEKQKSSVLVKINEKNSMKPKVVVPSPRGIPKPRRIDKSGATERDESPGASFTEKTIEGLKKSRTSSLVDSERKSRPSSKS